MPCDRMRLYLFNPDHDEAVAYNKPNYIADKASQALSADLATLMAWLASDGDAVVVPDVAVAEAWAGLPSVQACLPKVHWVQASGREPMACCATAHPTPWGWNRQVHRRLQRLGCENLPSEAHLDAVRRVAHREVAARLLHRLKKVLPEVVGEAHYCTTEAEVERSISVPHTTLLKLPWSGSGRGLRRGFGGLHKPLDGWVRNALERQGGVMVEPFYDKVSDFAMEFYADATTHSVRYIGMSCFATTGIGGYAGNRLATNEALMAEAEQGLRSGLLMAVRDAICQCLPEVLAGNYTGPLGIDMMTLRMPEGGEQVYLHPCVEINVRHTMGHVACALSARLAPESEGRFAIAYARTPQGLRELLPEGALSRSETAIVAPDGHVVEGYVPLTPLTEHSLFHAYLMAHKGER